MGERSPEHHSVVPEVGNSADGAPPQKLKG